MLAMEIFEIYLKVSHIESIKNLKNNVKSFGNNDFFHLIFSKRSVLKDEFNSSRITFHTCGGINKKYESRNI